MGKRRGGAGGGGGGKGPPPNTLVASDKSIALATKTGNHNPKSLLKLEHLRNLASWATSIPSIPSLAAFFGRQFAYSAEVLGVPLDPSALFQCQRCETILQPGFNCTIRIEKNRAKARCRRKKFSALMKNNVVYKCHYCSHFNRKRGIPKGHMKEICPPKPNPPAKSKSAKSMLQRFANLAEGTSSKGEIVKLDDTTLPAISVDTSIVENPANLFTRINIDKTIKADKTSLPAISLDTSIMNSPSPRNKTDDVIKIDETALPATSPNTSIVICPVTPQPSSGFSLLDAKKKKRNRSAKKPELPESNYATMDVEKTMSTSSKRKRKSWTSLKEIVEKRTLW